MFTPVIFAMLMRQRYQIYVSLIMKFACLLMTQKIKKSAGEC